MVVSSPSATPLSDDERGLLLGEAAKAIRHRVEHRAILRVSAADFPPTLRVVRATFVTLEVHHQLRGCIGTLEARRPLIEDVVANAQAAAFEDPRFPPVTSAEVGVLDIHISILSPMEMMTFVDEADLLRQVRPGVDGLVLEDRGRRGTFLPAVWEKVPDPRRFLAHLKMKAGLSADYWSPTVRVWRYTVESVPSSHT